MDQNRLHLMPIKYIKNVHLSDHTCYEKIRDRLHWNIFINENTLKGETSNESCRYQKMILKDKYLDFAYG